MEPTKKNPHHGKHLTQGDVADITRTIILMQSNYRITGDAGMKLVQLVLLHTWTGTPNNGRMIKTSTLSKIRKALEARGTIERKLPRVPKNAVLVESRHKPLQEWQRKKLYDTIEFLDYSPGGQAHIDLITPVVVQCIGRSLHYNRIGDYRTTMREAKGLPNRSPQRKDIHEPKDETEPFWEED